MYWLRQCGKSDTICSPLVDALAVANDLVIFLIYEYGKLTLMSIYFDIIHS
jgi:hypothetical protein